MIRLTSKTVSIVAISLLAVAAIDSATSASAADKQKIDRGIRNCVAEIAKHANYSGASRVVHWVSEIERRNRVELQMQVETSVYLTRDGAASRRYQSSCVRGALGRIVEFRIRENDTKT